MTIPTQYKAAIRARSTSRFYVGALARLPYHLWFSFIRTIARWKGAEIGDLTILPLALAWKANRNLSIGEDTIVDTSDLDLRAPIHIGNHVIINRGVSIIRVSHYIDQDPLFTSHYYPPQMIEDYCWIATGAHILPSCCQIRQGSVVGAFATIHKDTEPMGVYAGNPATLIRHHDSLHDQKVVVSMRGGDFLPYIKSRS